MDTSRYEIYFRARDSNRFLGLDFCTEELSILFFFFFGESNYEREIVGEEKLRSFLVAKFCFGTNGIIFFNFLGINCIRPFQK